MEGKTLRLVDIPAAFKEFADATARFLGARLGPLGPDWGHLDWRIEEDLRIADKSLLERANGRFRLEPTTYTQHYIPHAESPGVYFFLDGQDFAVYVGKSEPRGGIGTRVSSHVGRAAGDSFPQLRFEDAVSLVVVPLVEAPFLAPAFESYLLLNYQFRHNQNLLAS